MVLLVRCTVLKGMGLHRVDIHGHRKHLTCCLCGISGNYPVCFEGYACCEACEESGRMQHGVEIVCGTVGWKKCG